MSRIGLTFSKISALPPTMIASVPSTALGSPPETGASSISTPFFASAAATSWAARGAMELMSTTMLPLRAPSMTPPFPRTASFTCGELGSMVMMRSTCEAVSAGDDPALAPALTTSSTGAATTS